ncbi:MAG: TetR-like C-terminal domain-containing protein [Blautia sp.]|jgi:probable dihydroxyacetone kinase regulator
MSQTTKKALAASLKKLAKKKPLEKITVVDITEDCEVNRQTFYYHFQDIYDLVEWIFKQESIRVIDGNNTYATWQNGLLRVFGYVTENREFITSVYHSANREDLEQYLYRETFQLLLGVVEEKAEGLSVREEDKRFIADFYKFAFVGVLLEWIRGGMKEKPETIVKRMGMLLQGDFTKALETFAGKRHL